MNVFSSTLCELGGKYIPNRYKLTTLIELLLTKGLRCV